MPSSTLLDHAPARVPTLDVVCTGDPFEQGLAQGTELASAIRGTLRSLRDLEAFRLEQPAWLPFPVFRRLAERKVQRLWRLLSDAEPYMVRRLDGIVRGSRLTRGSIWLVHALESLVASTDGKTVDPPPAGCCAIAVRGRRSADGDPILAQNFDYLPLFQPFYIVRETRPRDGFRSLEFTFAPVAGAVDGINEHGLCVAYDYAYVVDAPSFAGTISMAISAMLRRCRTVVEGIALLRARPRWGGGLLMLADAEGDMASVELSNSRVGVRRPRDGEDVIYHTNRFQTSAMQGVEVGQEALFSDRAPAALRGVRVHHSSDERNRRFAKRVGGDAVLTSEDLLAVLADHGEDGVPGSTTICTHSSYWTTTATLQFSPRSRRMRIAYDTACRAKFETFEL